MKRTGLLLKLICVFTLVFNAISGSLFLIALINHDFIKELSVLYLAELTFEDSSVLMFLYFGFILHLLNVIGLSWMMIRATLISYLIFLIATTLILGMQMTTLSYEGYQKIIIELVLVSAVSIGYFINKKLNRKVLTSASEEIT